MSSRMGMDKIYRRGMRRTEPALKAARTWLPMASRSLTHADNHVCKHQIRRGRGQELSMTKLLFHQLFIQCHGFDMSEDLLPRLQS